MLTVTLALSPPSSAELDGALGCQFPIAKGEHQAYPVQHVLCRSVERDPEVINVDGEDEGPGESFSTLAPSSRAPGQLASVSSTKASVTRRDEAALCQLHYTPAKLPLALSPSLGSMRRSRSPIALREANEDNPLVI